MENQNPYLALIISGSLLLLMMIGFVIYFIRKRRHRDKSTERIYKKEVSPPNYYRHIYRFLANNRLTRAYAARVRLRYEMLEPGSVERIERDTVRSVSLLVGLIILLTGAVVFLPFIHVTLYTVLLVIWTIYCVNSEYLSKTTESMKLTILEQLRTEIEHIQNNYNHSEDVCDALYEAALNAPFPVKNHLLDIWEILQTDDKHINTEVERFNIRSPLPYLKDLLSCAKETAKYGDNNVHGISNFILKLTGIMNAVSAAERIEEERQEAFSGQTFVALVPFYLKPVCNWFAGKMFEVEGYINGVYGILTTIFMFILSFAIYGTISRRKELDYTCARSHPSLQRISNMPFMSSIINHMTNSDMARKNAIESKIHKIGESLTVEQFMMQRILFGLAGFALTIGTCMFIQISIRSNVLTSETGISTKITEGSTEEEEQDMIAFIAKTSQDLKDADLSDETIVIARVDHAGDLFLTETAKSLVAKEITRRVHSYQNAYFKFWYLLLGFITMAVCSFVPFFLIRRDPILVTIRSNDEIMRFQTIISCMKDIKRGSTKEVLEEMELSADIFRNTLTDCVDGYSSDPLYALERFQQRERDHPLLQQICMKFLRADRVGLRRAFANLEAEMEECQKNREQKCHFYIRRTSNAMFTIVFIPVLLEIVLEAMIPMGLAMFSQMNIMNNMLNL